MRDKKFAKMRSAPTVSIPSRHAAPSILASVSVAPPHPSAAAAAAAKVVPAQTKPTMASELKAAPNSTKLSATSSTNTDHEVRTRKADKRAESEKEVNVQSKRTAESVAAPLASPRRAEASSKTPSINTKKGVALPKKPLAKASKVNTVFSTGIVAPKKKKFNEYFGGDSTVVSAGDEDEHDDDEEGKESK